MLPYLIANSGTLVTFTAWVQRSSTNNTARIRIPADFIAGVTSDVIASTSAAINTWDQLTVTFTPSAAGVTPVYFECFGPTTGSGLVADCSLTQV